MGRPGPVNINDSGAGGRPEDPLTRIKEDLRFGLISEAEAKEMVRQVYLGITNTEGLRLFDNPAAKAQDWLDNVLTEKGYDETGRWLPEGTSSASPTGPKWISEGDRSELFMGEMPDGWRLGMDIRNAPLSLADKTLATNEFFDDESETKTGRAKTFYNYLAGMGLAPTLGNIVGKRGDALQSQYLLQGLNALTGLENKAYEDLKFGRTTTPGFGSFREYIGGKGGDMGDPMSGPGDLGAQLRTLRSFLSGGDDPFSSSHLGTEHAARKADDEFEGLFADAAQQALPPSLRRSGAGVMGRRMAAGQDLNPLTSPFQKYLAGNLFGVG